MDLANEFVVPRPIDQAWRVLTDVELIAPCLPGAQLKEVEGDIYRGVVKVKVGPILAQFAGQARFVELDEDNHRVVLDARGKEATGKGLASATVTAQLHDQGGSTRVEVNTQLTISGKIAQFGRGALADISAKLIDQFAERLEQTVLSRDDAGTEEGAPDDAPGAGATPSAEATPSGGAAATAGGGAGQPAEPGPAAAAGPAESARPPAGAVRTIDGPEAEPVNLLGSAGVPILKRLAPLVVLVVVVVVVLVMLLT